jgi:hypothetical protein
MANTALIHEPLNPEFGLRNIEVTYPIDSSIGADGRQYIQLLVQMLGGRGHFVRAASRDSFTKTIARRISGGRTAVDIAKYRLRSRWTANLLPVLKDPFQIMLSRSLLESGFGVLAVVRHPAAIWTSIRRMRWALSLDALGCKNSMENEWRRFSNGAALSQQSQIIVFAMLWRAIYGYVISLPAHPNFMLARHEDICACPEKFINEVEARFGLRAGAQTHRYIVQSMQAETVSLATMKLHEFRRNSRELAYAWRENIPADEEGLIKALTLDLVKDIYGTWTTD